MDDKRVLKYKRTKYIRESERFINKSVNFVSTKDLITKEEFDTFIDSLYSSFLEVEKVDLYSEYFNLLQTTIQKIVNLTKSDFSIDEIKKEILYSANQLRKLKRKRSFLRKKFNYQDELY